MKCVLVGLLIFGAVALVFADDDFSKFGVFFFFFDFLMRSSEPVEKLQNAWMGKITRRTTAITAGAKRAKWLAP